MQLKSFSSHHNLCLFVLGMTFVGSFVHCSVPESILKDPRFVTCMGEANGPEDPNFMTVFAKCYSFAGRPRFGKRSWRREEPSTYGNEPYMDSFDS